MSVLLTIAETAERLRVSRRTVYREIEAKKLRATKVRGSTFVAEIEVERYVRSAQRGRVA